MASIFVYMLKQQSNYIYNQWTVPSQKAHFLGLEVGVIIYPTTTILQIISQKKRQKATLFPVCCQHAAYLLLMFKS